MQTVCIEDSAVWTGLTATENVSATVYSPIVIEATAEAFSGRDVAPTRIYSGSHLFALLGFES